VILHLELGFCGTGFFHHFPGDTTRHIIGRSGKAILQEGLDLIHEFVDILELTVNRCKSDIGHWIQAIQFIHDDVADHFRPDLPLEHLVDLGLDLVRDFFELVKTDGAFFAGLQHSLENPLPVKRDPASIFLYYPER